MTLRRKGAVLSVLVLTLALIGCGEEKEMTAVEIRDAVVEAAANIETSQFDMNTTWNITRRNGESSEVLPLATVTGTGSGILDEANQKMETKMTFCLPPKKGGTINMEIEQYLVPKAIYTMTTMPGKPTTWTKKDLEKDWEEISPIKQEMELLTSGQVELLGSEQINGTDCYLLKVVPSIEKLWEAMIEPGIGVIIIEDEVDPEKVVEKGLMRVWVAKDSFFLMQDEIQIRMAMSSKALDLPLGEEEFDMIVDIEASSKHHNYNQPISIELPQEPEETAKTSALAPAGHGL